MVGASSGSGICLPALNLGGGSDTSLGPRLARGWSQPPGDLVVAEETSIGFAVRGWALEPDTVASSDAQLYPNAQYRDGRRSSGSATAGRSGSDRRHTRESARRDRGRRASTYQETFPPPDLDKKPGPRGWRESEHRGSSGTSAIPPNQKGPP
jgi:hypothetical protein